MTPQLEAAVALQLRLALIAAIRSLSLTEREQLLQILTQNDSASDSLTDLKTLNAQFRQGTSLSQLLVTQNPTTVHNLKDLTLEFWSEEDSIEDFLTFLRQQRQAVI
ncbi:hypothetical protein ACKFKG_08020 [Phormidesmis sp. 146-35]